MALLTYIIYNKQYSENNCRITLNLIECFVLLLLIISNIYRFHDDHGKSVTIHQQWYRSMLRIGVGWKFLPIFTLSQLWGMKHGCLKVKTFYKRTPFFRWKWSKMANILSNWCSLPLLDFTIYWGDAIKYYVNISLHRPKSGTPDHQQKKNNLKHHLIIWLKTKGSKCNASHICVFIFLFGT